MMWVSLLQGRSMHKAAVLMVLTVWSAVTGAQTPANKHHAVVSKAAVKPKMSASEEATAAAQAEAIAVAAGQRPAAAVGQVQSANRPVQVPVQVAAPSVSAPVAVKALPAAAPPAALAHASAVAPHDAVSPEELAIAQRVHQGQLACELGASIRVEHDAAQPGYFNLQGKGFRYRMRPVVTSTGAIRLEDAKAGAVWLQLANKSMLMDQKKGRRVADECANSEQLAYAESMKTNPPPKLFDTTGMGR
jgi:hypothetical protein